MGFKIEGLRMRPLQTEAVGALVIRMGFWGSILR